MGENSSIEWTHHTFNPWWGCALVSSGCENCYAETFSKRIGGSPWRKGKHWGVDGLRTITSAKQWAEPLKWDAAAKAAGERRRVFCASMADVFEDRPELEQPRQRLFALIEATPNLDWLILTKRPDFAAEWFAGASGAGLMAPTLPNLWMGTTVEDSDRLWRAYALLRIPAAVHFISNEPSLELVDFSRVIEGLYRCECGDVMVPRASNWHWDGASFKHSGCGGRTARSFSRIDWVIVGGESGPGARPFSVEWARSVVEQCRAAGVAVFVKQLGANVFDPSRLLWHSPTEAGEIGLWEVGHRTTRQVASVWPNGTWHTWDARGIGGENGHEASVEVAKQEAEDSLVRQHTWPIKGWWSHRSTCSDRKGGDMSEWPEDLRVREFPEVARG